LNLSINYPESYKHKQQKNVDNGRIFKSDTQLKSRQNRRFIYVFEFL